ncbi:unnamed protein product [Amoebophrya sp. A25]|nr:unnamed protein product [Amoebophrya sp. A25]|eukprot:GSA25T00015737001.1
MRSAQLWGAACVFGIMTEVLKLRRLYCDNADLTPEQRRHVRNLLLRTILVHLCDMAVPARVGLGFAIPEKQLAGMHLVAAMIQCGNLFPAPAPFRML